MSHRKRDPQRARQGRGGLSKHVDRFCAKCSRTTTWVLFLKAKLRACVRCGTQRGE